MNIRSRFCVCGALLGGVATAACGGGDSPTGSQGIVQLVSVTTNTLTIQCGRNNHLASPDSLYLYAHLVNTSAIDVAVDSVGSSGYILTASDPSVAGQGANNFTSLPFTPRPALLQARTGDLTLTVSLPTNPLCAAVPLTFEYKDISTSLRVTTSAGQYVSVPFTIHVNFVGPALIRR